MRKQSNNDRTMIDNCRSTTLRITFLQSLLLGLRYSELSWEMAKPSDEGNLDCLPCLFLQFPVRENGARVYKILQVFSRQVRFPLDHVNFKP